MEFIVKVIKGIVSPEEQEIRTSVFVEEQGFQDEFDAMDSFSTHYVGYLGDKAIGCMRVFYDEDKKRYTLGRFAIRKEYRNQGYGRALMEAVVSDCKKEEINLLFLHAQKRAVGFYERLGFLAFGTYDMDEGYPHIWMKKEI